MENLFTDFWHWWVLGLIFLVLEVFAPGAIFLWMAVGAGLVGGIMLAVPDLGWEYQLMIFSVFSVVSVVLFRRWQRDNPTETDQPMLNRRGHQYIGRVFTLDEAIVNSDGKLNVDDTTWRINGPDMPEGSRVKVTGVNGVVLLVEAAD